MSKIRCSECELEQADRLAEIFTVFKQCVLCSECITIAYHAMMLRQEEREAVAAKKRAPDLSSYGRR